MKKLLLAIVASVAALVAHAQVTVPADATMESWVATFVMHSNTGAGEQTETVSEQMDVAFSGNDVYFNLPNPIAGNTWVVGTVADGKATFASGQLLGNYGGKVYLVGQNEQGLCDIVFSYDADRGRFTQGEMNIVLSASATTVDAWAYYTGMTVTKGGEVQLEDGTVAPPADATVETWTMTGRNVNPNNESQYEDLNETVKVAFSGSEIYIQGLCPANGWLKGVVADGTATFSKRQFLGTAEGYRFYAIGYEGADAIDIVFSYDAEQGLLTTVSYILLINDDDQVLMELTGVTLRRSGEAVEEPTVEAPADLATREYVLKATSIKYNADGSIAGMEPAQWNVRLGQKGNEVYIQGLFEAMPLAWVKGTLDDDELTLKRGQYYGAHPQLSSMKFYFASQYFGELSDMVMSYDTSTRTYTGGGYYLLVNSSKTAIAPYYVFAGVTISPVADVAAVPANPVVETYQAFNDEFGYGYVCFTLPTVDVNGNAINRDNMGYRLYTEQDGQQSVYTFKQTLYENLAEDTETIPYFYADSYDFYMGGSFVALYEESLQWSKLGVQTVYKAGGKENCSDITWYELTEGDVDAITTQMNTCKGAAVVYDLQGRRVAEPGKGLYIVNGKKVVLK